MQIQETTDINGKPHQHASKTVDAATRSLKVLAKITVLAIICFSTFISPAFANPAPRFHSEQEAQQHCPNDTVVWVNTKTGVYHFKGERWYGTTKEGVYVCRKEADAEGDRSTRNGQ